MIEQIKQKALKDGVPIIKDDGLVFLLDLIKKKNYKRILELGTAVGYSAINIAKINKDIHVDTIEKNGDMYKQAIININNESLNNQIDVYHLPIEDFKTDKKYDLIFVDAAKAQYGKYLEMFIDNLDEKGIMFFDNMVFHGLINDIEHIESRSLRNLLKKLYKFREMVRNDERFDIMLCDNIGDGILLLSRRESET